MQTNTGLYTGSLHQVVTSKSHPYLSLWLQCVRVCVCARTCEVFYCTKKQWRGPSYSMQKVSQSLPFLLARLTAYLLAHILKWRVNLPHINSMKSNISKTEEADKYPHGSDEVYWFLPLVLQAECWIHSSASQRNLLPKCYNSAQCWCNYCSEFCFFLFFFSSWQRLIHQIDSLHRSLWGAHVDWIFICCAVQPTTVFSESFTLCEERCLSCVPQNRRFWQQPEDFHPLYNVLLIGGFTVLFWEYPKIHHLK